MSETTITPVLSPTTLAIVAAYNRPGAFQRVAWTTTVKPAAAHKGTVLTKHTVAVIRTGIAYANLGVNDGVDTGPLPWGQWAIFPYVITHKGAEYVRLYVASKVCPACEGKPVVRWVMRDGLAAPVVCRRCQGKGTVPRIESTVYAVDGVTVTREEFNSYLTPGARKPSAPNGGTITPKAANVTVL
jgi:hypothetical protein